MTSSGARRLAVLTAVVVCSTATVAAANPVDAFGLGARSTALGSAATAIVDDFSANYYNPAALAADPRMRLEFGYSYLKPTLTINGGDLGVDEHRGFQGGFVLPGSVFGHRLAFSVGLFLPDRLITRIRALPQRQPRFALYDNRPQRLVLSASLAFQILDDLYVGAGLTFLSHTRGKLDIAGQVGFTDTEETNLRASLDEDLVAVRYPTVGVLYTPGNWRFGATYREQFALQLDLEVLVHGDIVESGQVTIEDASFQLFSFNHNLFSPRQLSLGAAYDAGCWLVSVDLTWAQWSRFPSPTATVDVELAIPGLPLDIPPPDKPSPPDFHDIFIPRIGAEVLVVDHDVVGLRLRGGYFYEPTPAPPQRGITNYVDTDKHGFSAGFGLRLTVLDEVLPQPLEFDGYVQVIYMSRRTTTKDDPADPIGDYVAEGLWVGAGFTTKLLF